MQPLFSLALVLTAAAIQRCASFSTISPSTNAPSTAANGANVIGGPSSSSPTLISKNAPDTPTKPSIPPLHQNWWPLALTNTLNPNAPNPEQLLGMDLVLWHDGAEWRCHEDMCAHRYAPLSEGRIVKINSENQASGISDDSEDGPNKCLQCSYHGWEFNSQGQCTRIPQAESQHEAHLCSANSVASYPVKVEAGIIWVWPDVETAPFSKLVQVPVSPMLKAWQDQYPQSAYQRDLPYGYELLTENVIDMSHLPFSHHGVLSDRDKAGVHLPLKMMNVEEKEKVWQEEADSLYAAEIPSGATNDGDNSISELPPPLPLYQVQIKPALAQFADPIFAGAQIGDNEADETSTSYLGFYPPSHVRYHRTPKSGYSSNTELFVVPQSGGRCRVIIFNPFEFAMKQIKPDPADTKRRVKLLAKVGKLLLRNVVFRNLLGTNNHLLTSDVFDGDNVFLAQQGERMAKTGLEHVDYKAVSTADMMTKVFRKWLDVAAENTRKASTAVSGANATNRDAANTKSAEKTNSILEAATGQASKGKVSPYIVKNSNVSNEMLLDRYDSHTKSCPICSTALVKLQRKKKGLEALLPALMGMTGASLMSTVLFGLLVNASTLDISLTASRAIVKVSAKLFGTSFALAFLSNFVKSRTEKTIQKFYYVPHSHQDEVSN